MVRTAKVTPEQLAALLRQSATATPNPAALSAVGATFEKEVDVQMKIKKLGALLVSVALCAGMAAPAFAFEGEACPGGTAGSAGSRWRKMLSPSRTKPLVP